MTLSRFSVVIVTAALTGCLAVQRMHAQAPTVTMKPSMTAKLIEPEKKAAGRTVTVEITTSGVEMVDPSVSMEKAVPG